MSFLLIEGLILGLRPGVTNLFDPISCNVAIEWNEGYPATLLKSYMFSAGLWLHNIVKKTDWCEETTTNNNLSAFHLYIYWVPKRYVHDEMIMNELLIKIEINSLFVSFLQK